MAAIRAESIGNIYKLGQLHNICGLARAAVGGSIESRRQLRYRPNLPKRSAGA